MPEMPDLDMPEPGGAARFDALVEAALAEDLGGGVISSAGDLTTAWTVPADSRARARIIARGPGIVAGLAVARAVFARLDSACDFQAEVQEGGAVGDGDVLARLEGTARSLLTGERTALNFLQRLCGVASLTRTYVEAIAGTRARITDTRKTTPGLRALDAQAVLLGGGVNHRLGLYDAVLIKENHAAAAGGVGEAVRRARRSAAESGNPAVPVYAEAGDLDEVCRLIAVRPDRIMLDNMDLGTIRRAVSAIREADPAIEIEATGGVSLENVRLIAEAGVDLISIGALTHSAPALDLSMLFSGA